MKKLLTIAVPTYNIPQYIEKNIESFQEIDNQLKDRFEVLIINDGSTDNTLEVAEACIFKDSFLDIRIINKENGGHGSAVNRGIEEASGKYFKIVDGDDWVEKTAFEELLRRLDNEEADLVVTDFTEQHVYNNTTKFIKVLELEDQARGNGIPVERVLMHGITYKTSILKDNHIRLSEGIFYVDVQYACFPLEYIKSFVYYDLNVYQYLLGRPEQSMAWKSKLKNEEHHMKVTASIFDLYRKDQKSEVREILQKVLTQLVGDQYLISRLSGNQANLDKLTKMVNLSDFHFTIAKGRTTRYLIYLENKTKHKFSFILNPLINHRMKQYDKYIQ